MAASAAVSGAVDVVVGVAAVDWLSSPSSSTRRRRRHCRCAQDATQPCERPWDD